MAADFDEGILNELVVAQLGSDASPLRFSPVTTGKHNRSYWVDCPVGRFVLRVAPDDDDGFLYYERLMMRQEPELHKLIRERTAIPIPEIVGHDFSRKRIDRDYLIMKALPGTPISEMGGLTGVMYSRAMEQVGEYLNQLHNLTAKNCLGSNLYGYLGAHQPMEAQTNWGDAFLVMWNLLLDDVVACSTYSQDDAQIMRDLFEHHKAHFQRQVTPRLLHMDVWSQNILVDGDGNVTGMVDFDRALWGDKEIEFAVLDYCGISEPGFWRGYGSERDTGEPALIRRQFYLLYEVQKYMPIRVWRRNNPVAAERYKRQSFALARELM